jgi:hypothetical protein
MQSAALLRNRAKMSKCASIPWIWGLSERFAQRMSLDPAATCCGQDHHRHVGGLQVPPGFILGPPLWFGFGTPRYQVHASLWLAM